jgi:DNA-binding GntR family transcriptional regulator
MLGHRMSRNVGDHLVSAQQATHAKLRAMIFSGEFQAGQPLRQEEIARQLGVSRLPVREALNRLATEGLVELKPRRGFFVTSLNADEIEDIFDMRAMLEERAGYLATKSRTTADADALDIAVRALDIAIDAPIAFDHWADLNLRFHTRLYQSCARKHLCRQIDLLRDTVAPFIRILASQDGELQRSQAEHRQMASFFRAGDAAAVGKICREHCDYTARGLVKQLRAMSAVDQTTNDTKAA